MFTPYVPSTRTVDSTPTVRCSFGGESCALNHAKHFQHEVLQPGEIRLLKIPKRGHRSFDPHLLVEIYTREVAPPYVALSYTWGDGDACERIILNSRAKLVRSNLYWALYYICGISSLNVEYIWVDALCINQDVMEERNEQVGTMSRTYSEACSVIAWLGLLDDAALNNKHIKSPKSLSVPDGILRFILWDLAHRPYWSRMWVIQEILLARNISILCGKYIISWSSFCQALQAQVRSHDFQYPNAHPCALHFHRVRQKPNWRHLGSLLRTYRGSACKDPRDRIFALLSLLPQQERRALNEYFPNYRLSEETVKLMTLRHLRSKASLSLQELKDDTALRQAFGIRSYQEWKRFLDASSKDETDITFASKKLLGGNFEMVDSDAATFAWFPSHSGPDEEWQMVESDTASGTEISWDLVEGSTGEWQELIGHVSGQTRWQGWNRQSYGRDARAP